MRFPTVIPPFGSHGVTHLRLERRAPSHAGYAGEQTAQGVLEPAAEMPWCGRAWLKYVTYSLRTRWSCFSWRISRWSRHSCRTLLKKRSQIALARGAWKGVLRISIALVVATRAKQNPNLRSLLQIRYFGACPYGVASRSCCAIQRSVGDRVTPTWITFRDFSSMMKNTKSGRKKRSVTCKKSQAQICAAWLCKKVAHFWPLGWGVRPFLMYFWIVRLQTRMPSFNNSPRILSAPQSRFSFAISLINAIVSAATLGLCEEAFDLRFQYRRKSSRCHRSRVSGWTRNSVCTSLCNQWRHTLSCVTAAFPERMCQVASTAECHLPPWGDRIDRWRAKWYGNGHASFGEGRLEKGYRKMVPRQSHTQLGASVRGKRWTLRTDVSSS